MANRCLPQPTLSVGIVLLGLMTAGCDGLPCLPGGLGNCEPPIEQDVVTQVGHGSCLPVFGTLVYSADMNKAGNRVIVISGSKPATLPEDHGWGDNDRALEVYNVTAGGASTSRHIATTWESPDVILPFATPEDGGDVDQDNVVHLIEEMSEVQLDDAGERFVVAVSRSDTPDGYSKLYSGMIPAQGFANYSPETGELVQLGVNADNGTESIRSFVLSPDGTKVAVTVGAQSELRVLDLTADAEAISIYELNKGGKDVVVSHALPDPCTGIDCRRTPSVTSRGLLRVTWAPNGQRLAIVRTDSAASPGQTTLSLMDVASGDLTKVRSFQDSGAPHVAWAADGESMFVMNTPFSSAGESIEPVLTDGAFGNTLIRHIAAAEGGKELGAGARLPRQVGWTTDPVNLTLLKDGQSLVFIWESRLYRLDMPGGDLSKAVSAYLLDRQKVPEDLSVIPNMVATSPDQDSVLVLIEDSVGRRAALRTMASKDACPAPAGEEAAATVEAPAGDVAPTP